jgi:hypothetical protein
LRSDPRESGAAMRGRCLWTPGGELRVAGDALITSEAMRRLNGEELIEIEIGDGLQRLAGGGVTQRLGQRFEPLRVVGLQSDQFGHGVTPALMTAAAIDRPAVADDRSTGMACAVARLALGAGKGLVALWFASSGHGSQVRHVT